MSQLTGFDPLKFLDISSLKDQEKDAVNKNLLNKISQYLLIRISELLSDEDLKNAKNSEEIFSIAREKIPDLNEKVKSFMEDFKKEFYSNINK